MRCDDISGQAFGSSIWDARRRRELHFLPCSAVGGATRLCLHPYRRSRSQPAGKLQLRTAGWSFSLPSVSFSFSARDAEPSALSCPQPGLGYQGCDAAGQPGFTCAPWLGGGPSALKIWRDFLAATRATPLGEGWTGRSDSPIPVRLSWSRLCHFLLSSSLSAF